MGISRNQKTALSGIAFFFVLFILTPIRLHAQELFKFKKVDTLLEEADAELHDYRVYAFDILSFKAAVDEIKGDSNQKSFQFDVPGIGVFRFFLRPHDIRSPQYRLTAATENGMISIPRSANKTYRGYTEQANRDVRFTLDTAFMSGFIEMEEERFYFETSNHYTGELASQPFIVVYSTLDIIEQEEAVCIEGERPEGPRNNHHDHGTGQRNSACLELEVNLANDFLMYQEYSSNVTMVENQNLSVLNDVETNYDNEFDNDMQFEVNQIFVSTCATCDPWPDTDDISTILSSFKNWAPTGFSEPHDVATLWSPRNFTDPDVGNGVIGLAYVGVICGSFRYNVCEDYSNNANSLRVLQAHEMGHNFDAEHDASGSPYIMAPSVNNTNDWSVDSENTINAFTATLNCLGPCAAGSAPTASFIANITDGCTPFEVQFSDNSENLPTSWSWTFEGGTPSTSTEQNPVVTYSTPGSFAVTLEVSNNFGSDATTISDYITAGSAPTADFTYTVNDLTASFANFSDNYDQVFWDFGDGFTSTDINPVHIYDGDGIYNVMLTVSNNCGEETFSLSIEIITSPIAGFTADQTTGCEPLTVQFFNQSSENTDAFFWTFEGGLPSTSTAPNPVVEYPEPGLYSVTLVVSNDIGSDQITVNEMIDVQPAPFADFTYSVQGSIVTFNALQASNLSFIWEFGDGSTGSGLNVVHAYPGPGTYDVMLIASNGCGNDTIIETLNLQGAPVPAFNSSATTGCLPLEVQFEDASEGQVEIYSWVFEGGNPGTSSQQNPLVLYQQAGTYDVQLTVTNSIGSETIVLADHITVFPDPASGFQYSVDGNDVVFTNTSVNADTWSWDFGDGWNSNQFEPSHTYPADGTYQVTLIASNQCGSSSFTQEIEIATPPQAGLGFDQSTGCAPFMVEFENQSSANANSFLWTFEGGIPASSTEENPNVLFPEPGSYTVQLEAVSNGGTDIVTMTDVITVLPQPLADFAVLEIEGRVARFSNLSENGNSYAWSFGDGLFSSETNPEHEYSAFGTYQVQLIVTNVCGSDTINRTIELATSPVVQFTASQTTGCTPMTVQFMDESLNQPTSWVWLFPGGTPATSTEQNPEIVYTSPGVYRVELVASNEAGARELVRDDFIIVGSPPAGSFDYSIEGNLVQFQNTTPNATEVLWEFGNGTSSNLDEVEIEYLLDGEYEVRMIVRNPCGADTVMATIVIGLTNLEENKAGTISVYPNPTLDHVWISTTEDQETWVGIRCLNGLGQVVYQRDAQLLSGQLPLRVDLSHLKSGIYYLNIESGNGKEVFPIVIQSDGR